MSRETIQITKGIKLIHNYFPSHISDSIIDKIEKECRLDNFTISEKILCRTGSFEGDTIRNNSTPWLRCPSIEHQIIYSWSDTLRMIRDDIIKSLGFYTNIAKLQKYSDGNAYINVHSDKIIDLDEKTPIFIIRFGASRTCIFINKVTNATLFVTVPHNSMLIIDYDANLIWKHGIQKESHIVDASYSIVYRKSVTFKYQDYIYGFRTPFITIYELFSYIKDKEKYKEKNKELWDKDTYHKNIVRCFAFENKNKVNLKLYNEIMEYSPFAF